MSFQIIKGLGQKLMSDNKDKSTVVIGRIEGRPFEKDTLTEAQLNHHVHVVGASGFGKTVFLSQIIKQQIENGKGLLFIDLKSDIETMTNFANFAVQSGREKDFQNFSLGDHQYSMAYNLLGEGSATQIRDRIMSSLTWSEEYYRNVSSSYLLRVLIGLCFLRKSKGLVLHLGTLLKACEDQDFLKSLYNQVPEPEAAVKAAIKDAATFIGVPDQLRALQGLRSQLESIVLSDFGDLVASDRAGIDLFETVREGKLVFLYLDTRRYGETAKTIGRFILQDLKAVSARIDGEVKKDERKPFSVIIDEFADLAQEDFIGFLDRARSSKMSIVVSHQEICDLQRVSPEFAGRLMGNTSSLYAFLQKRPESAELISSIAGTKKTWKETERVSQGWIFETATGEKSVREVEEFLIHPNTIKRLRVGEAVVIKKYPQSVAYKIRVDSNLA
jgi:conjugal transfer pilus assembly protein TraD